MTNEAPHIFQTLKQQIAFVSSIHVKKKEEKKKKALTHDMNKRSNHHLPSTVNTQSHHFTYTYAISTRR